MNIERIEALVKKHYSDWRTAATAISVQDQMRNALTEQAESFKGELQAYDGMVRELTKTVEDMQAAQSVPVVGEAVAYVRAKKLNVLPPGGLVNCYLYDPSSIDEYDCDDLVAVFREPTNSILAAELATLREKAAEADELRKDAERYRWLRIGKNDAKAIDLIEDHCDTDLDSAIDAAIAQGKGE